MNKLFAVIFASVVLAACTSTPKVNSAASSTNALPPQATNTPPIVNAAATTVASAEKQPPISALKHEQNDESVYFDFDKSKIKPKFMEEIKNYAEWMRSHQDSVLTLDGNADERGSEKYNLMLGGRRAAAVHKALVMMGIADQRIKDVSFGKDKPRATCGEERCWQANRRVDFDFKQG